MRRLNQRCIEKARIICTCIIQLTPEYALNLIGTLPSIKGSVSKIPKFSRRYCSGFMFGWLLLIRCLNHNATNKSTSSIEIPSNRAPLWGGRFRRNKPEHATTRSRTLVLSFPCCMQSIQACVLQVRMHECFRMRSHYLHGHFQTQPHSSRWLLGLVWL